MPHDKVGSSAVIDVSINTTERLKIPLLDFKPELLIAKVIEGKQKMKINPSRPMSIGREKSNRFFTFRAG